MSDSSPEKTLNTRSDGTWNARLLHLAREQEQKRALINQLQDERNMLFEEHIYPREARVKALADELATLEAGIKADFLAYVLETGDVHAHPKLTFRRSTRLEYDADAVLQAAETHGAAHLCKKKLDVREFERLYREGQLSWAEVKEVSAPTVALARLGDLLVESEVDGDLGGSA